MTKEMRPIKEWIAHKAAEQASLQIKLAKNGESMYEHEVEEFVTLFRESLLELNGYGNEDEE